MASIPGLWEFVQDVASSIVNLASWTFRVAGRLIAYAAIVAVVSYLLWSNLDAARDKQITLLVGPFAGSGEEVYNVSKRSVASFSSADWFGERYSLTPQWTGGSSEHISRLNADRDGRLVAFVEDGTASGEDNVRTLLPLNEMFLHFIVRKEFLDELRRRDRASENRLENPTFELIAGTINELHEDSDDIAEPPNAAEPFTCQLYLGPPQSGTRKIALQLLNEFGIRSDDVQSQGVADFSEMRTALRTGRIDGAFILSNPGGKLVRGIALDGKCRLIGIGNALGWSANLPTLRAGKIPQAMFAALDSSFCPADVDSLYSRLILAASSSMDDNRAYAVASAFHDALHAKFPKFAWEDESAYAMNGQPHSALAFPIHAGARWLQSGHVPSLVGDHPFIAAGLGILALAALRAVFNDAKSWWSGKHEERAASPISVPAPSPNTPGDRATGTPTPVEIAADAVLFECVGQLLDEVEVATGPAPAELDQWTERYRDFRRQARKLAVQNAIRPHLHDDIMDYLATISSELQQFQPRKSLASARPTSGSVPAPTQPSRRGS